MSVCQFVTDDVHFGFALNREVKSPLQRSVVSVGSRTESLRTLDSALKASPDQLEVLMALYRFHCHRGNLDDAEDAVFQTLIKAAQQGCFNYDWNHLDRHSADWSTARGPGQIYLYSLKALAFIRLRQEMPLDATKILNSLNRIDPDDLVGANVVREMLDRLHEH